MTDFSIGHTCSSLKRLRDVEALQQAVLENLRLIRRLLGGLILGMGDFLRSIIEVGKPREEQARPRITTDPDGLEVHVGEYLIAGVEWIGIEKIVAYKHDLWTTDEICLGLLTDKDANEWLEISEEWDGFVEVVGQIESKFMTIPANWYAEMMVPAFRAKPTVLFVKKDADTHG